jgi:two-component system chemotaxis response regulator CheY
MMPRVLSVGQCGYDHGMISRRLVRDFGADVVGAATFDEALTALRSGAFDLVLVNRVTDRDGSHGITFVQTVKADPELSSIPVMLVSNHESAQAEAVRTGALQGFGKDDVGKTAWFTAVETVIPRR